MAMLKTKWGHTPVSKGGKGGDCFRYLKYGNGRTGVKRYLEKDAHSLATDLINLPFVDERDGDWGEELYGPGSELNLDKRDASFIYLAGGKKNPYRR